KDQADVLRAFTIANEALVEARSMLSDVEIQTQLDMLSESFEHISMAGELLSEDLSGTGSTLESEERIDRQLESLEAEVLLEKEGVLPPLQTEGEVSAGKGSDAEEERVEKMLADLEEEAKAEKEREAER
ncbi:MAG: hypothetical protein RTU92_13825, partial [Candidatus Thorarchaeota archaeon]